MCKERDVLDKILDFLDKKIEACGSFKDGPEGAALRSVREYIAKVQEETYARKIDSQNKKGGLVVVDETALQNYLLKCELQYRAEHTDGVERVGWLMEYCKAVKQTARFLRDIGFRVKDIVDDVDCAGDRHAWVVTTSGVVVYADGSGLIGREVH